jgi:hypothetical protein
MLKDKIAAVEVQMKAKLEEARATFTHPGDKGTSVEDSFRAFLRCYLSRRLEVGNGEIIDRKGRRSVQTDVVIVSEDHPFTFTPDLPGFFFIEGVCAAGEVKTNLTSTELKKALENSCQFKQLEVDPGQGTLANTNPSDLERFYKCPPWFLVAFESQLTLSRIQIEIVEFKNQNSVESNRLADAVFVLGRGWVINYGDGEGSFQFKTPEGISLEGWHWQNSDSVLFDLLGWLSAVMPRMIRFEPILPKYILPGK